MISKSIPVSQKIRYSKGTNMRRNKQNRKHGKLKFIITAIVIVIGILLWRENQRIIVCIDAGHGGKDVRFCVDR